MQAKLMSAQVAWKAMFLMVVVVNLVYVTQLRVRAVLGLMGMRLIRMLVSRVGVWGGRDMMGWRGCLRML